MKNELGGSPKNQSATVQVKQAKNIVKTAQAKESAQLQDITLLKGDKGDQGIQGEPGIVDVESLSVAVQQIFVNSNGDPIALQ